MTEKPAPLTPDHVNQLIHAVQLALHQDRFVKLVLGKYRGDEPDLKRITVRQLTLQGEPCLSFVYSYTTKDITKNGPARRGLHIIRQLLGESFKSAHLFSTTEDIQLEFNKKGRTSLHTGRPSHKELPSDVHNQDKSRLIDPAKPFLASLGVTDSDHRVIPSMGRKWKQINKFLEIFSHAVSESGLTGKTGLRVVDFGSGKGYLTFAVHDYLANTLRTRPEVTGIELRKELTAFCNDQASALAAEGLSFVEGDLNSYRPGPTDIVIALHACDTATDQAIYIGITSGAGIIMCSPCCHKEIRPQIICPEILHPMLKHGVHLGQEAEMITDTLRVLLLEASGYKTQLLEFISLEHTGKNKMILAVKQSGPMHRDAAMTSYRSIMDFYGIKTHTLEMLLNQPSAHCATPEKRK